MTTQISLFRSWNRAVISRELEYRPFALTHIIFVVIGAIWASWGTRGASGGVFGVFGVGVVGGVDIGGIRGTGGGRLEEVDDFVVVGVPGMGVVGVRVEEGVWR